MMDQGKPSQMKRGDVRGPIGAGVRKSGNGMDVLGTLLRVCGEGQLRRGVAVSAQRNRVSRQACVDSSNGNVGFGEERQERQPALVQQTRPCFFKYVEPRVPLPEQ